VVAEFFADDALHDFVGFGVDAFSHISFGLKEGGERDHTC
jgi:hypothetical protein